MIHYPQNIAKKGSWMDILVGSRLTPLSIRPGDLKAINNLLQQLSPGRTHRLLRRELFLVLLSFSRYVFVVREERRIVGIATMSLKRNLSYGRFAWVDDVVVDETMRGRGLGQKLMQEIERWAKAKGALGSSLTTRRPEAQRLYEKLGYTATGTTYMAKWLNWSERFKKAE